MRSTEDPSDILLITGLSPHTELLSSIRDEIFKQGLTNNEIITLVNSRFEAAGYQDYDKDALTIRRGVTEIREFLLSCNDHF